MAPAPGDKYWNGALYKEGVKAALLALEKPGGVGYKSIRKHFDANLKVKLRQDYGRYLWKAFRRLMQSGEVVEIAPKRYKYKPLKLTKKMKESMEALRPPLRPRNSVTDEYMLVVRVLREMNEEGGSDLESMHKYVKDTYSEEELHYDHKNLFNSFLEGMVRDGKVKLNNNLYKLSDAILKEFSNADADADAAADHLDFTAFNI